MKFQLPLNSLPSDESKRIEMLHKYFSDLRSSVKKGKKGWDISLFWPPTLDYFIDPNLEKGLMWWGTKSPADKLQELYKIEQNFQLSLHDCWTLFSWSKWLKERKLRNAYPQEVIILHVDDHNDLMSPRITKKNTGFEDILTGKKINILQPSTISNAIKSGAIGIGSFIVPFLHSIPKVIIRHLRFNTLSINLEKKYLQLEVENDSLMQPRALRPIVKCTCLDSDAPSQSVEYFRTSNIIRWLEDLPDVPILLHIDMDYFNNRYDGDSDWKDKINHDLNIDEIIREMEMLFLNLNKKPIKQNIENITVALSPGFFPAEFWEPSIQRISSLIAHLKKEPRNKKIDKLSELRRNIELRPSTSKNLSKKRFLFYWHIYFQKVKAGKVYITTLSDPIIGVHYAVNIYLNKQSQNKGIGRIGYNLACRLSNLNEVYAHMSKKNIMSKKAAMAAGFKELKNEKFNQTVMLWKKSENL